jgi:CBS domain-containing protein
MEGLNEMAKGTRFSDEEMERIAAEHDRGEFETDVDRGEVIEADASGKTDVMSVRLPRSVIAALKSAAEERAIGATVLARELILAGLAETNDAALSATITMRELIALAARRARMTAPDDPPPARDIEPAQSAVEPVRSTALSSGHFVFDPSLQAAAYGDQGSKETPYVEQYGQERSQPMPTARDIMIAGTECANENDTVQQAAEKMTRLGVGALPICGSDNRLKGMLTDRDIVVKVLGLGKDPSSTRAGELGQREIVTIGADDDADEIMRTMISHKVRRLPVIDGHDLVGMVTEADVARALPSPQVGDLTRRRG